MKVLTRTLLVLLAVPLVLAIGARFVSHPSATPAPTAATTMTMLKLPPTSAVGTINCIKWRQEHCVESEFFTGGGVIFVGGAASFSLSTLTVHKHGR